MIVAGVGGTVSLSQGNIVIGVGDVGGGGVGEVGGRVSERICEGLVVSGRSSDAVASGRTGSGGLLKFTGIGRDGAALACKTKVGICGGGDGGGGVVAAATAAETANSSQTEASLTT